MAKICVKFQEYSLVIDEDNLLQIDGQKLHIFKDYAYVKQLKIDKLSNFIGQSIINGFNPQEHSIIALNYQDRQIEQIQKFLIGTHKKGTKLIEAVNSKFVTSRGLISRMIYSPLGFYYDEGLAFFSVKYKGIIFIKEAKTQYKLNNQLGQNLNLQHSIYGGLQFEKMVLKEQANLGLYGIFKAKLEKDKCEMDLLYTAEIDAMKLTPIELKTKAVKSFERGIPEDITLMDIKQIDPSALKFPANWATTGLDYAHNLFSEVIKEHELRQEMEILYWDRDHGKKEFVHKAIDSSQNFILQEFQDHFV